MVQLKGAWERHQHVLLALFQYLMVQLKANLINKVSKKDVISIPHGTIKSYKSKWWIPSSMIFQYLMVQLKAC